jgi:hypothetical protein
MARRSPYPHSQPQPEGERVMLPGEGGVPNSRSKFSKAPGPMSAEDRNTTRRAGAARKRWEGTDEGRARTQDARSLLSTQMTNAQIYMVKGWDQQTGIGPKHYDRQLPGMSDPYAAPRPPKWEELPKETQEHVERELAKRGTSIAQMTKDVGAQADQGHVRADSYGHERPYAQDFYSTGEPRKVLDSSAKKLGIPQPVHAAMNAFTSPNTKFALKTKDGMVYPNDAAAAHAVEHVQSGGTYKDLTNQRTDDPTKSHQGYTRNMKKAAHTYKQYEQGVTPDQWRGVPSKTKPEGGSPWEAAPKTGPYANSWSDSHPQFFVSDVHSGGGGMVPHLGTEKPIKVDAQGNQKLTKAGKPDRDDSEREKAISDVPFFHSAADFSARQAMVQRGVGSVRDFQAGQWGEEQIQRGEAGHRQAPKATDVYGRSEAFHGSRNTALDEAESAVTAYRGKSTKKAPAHEQGGMF